jgi:transglutaminase-like putative cysteine protease
MHLHIGFRLRFAVPAPTPMLLQLQVLPNRYVFPRPEQLTLSPDLTTSETFVDSFGNASRRLVAPTGQFTIANDGIVDVSEQPDLVDDQAIQHQINHLPIDTLRYLVGSRYCEIDRLGEFAWQTFGNGATGYRRVQAVCQFVHQHIHFGYAFARPTKSAADVFAEQRGVCRDFAHLAITLCRSLGIPARYATGYLGDIGVPIDPAPMDFSAWFEAFLSGQWFTFDARHNHPRIGRVVMAYGRDAADTALTTSFGPTVLQQFEVWCEAAAGE